MHNESLEEVQAWYDYTANARALYSASNADVRTELLACKIQTELTQAQRIEAQRKASEINRKELEQYRKSKAERLNKNAI